MANEDQIERSELLGQLASDNIQASRIDGEWDEGEVQEKPQLNLTSYNLESYRQYVVEIQGKSYMTVAGRLKIFWDIVNDYKKSINKRVPTHIITDVKIDGNRVVCKAIIEVNYELSTTGWASEVIGDGPINKDAAIENVETSAVGRALGNLGIGLLEAGGVASAEEVQRVYQKKPASDKQKEYIRKLATEQGKPIPDDEWFDSLTMDMAKASISKLLANQKNQPATIFYSDQEPIIDEYLPPHDVKN